MPECGLGHRVALDALQTFKSYVGGQVLAEQQVRGAVDLQQQRPADFVVVLQLAAGAKPADFDGLRSKSDERYTEHWG